MSREYFESQNQKINFIDNMDQLMQISSQQEQFQQWLDGLAYDTPNKKRLFERLDENQLKLPNNYKKWSDEKKYQYWLKNECNQSFDSYEFNKHPTHLNIWFHLVDAKTKGIISTQQLQKLLVFRQLMFDSFHLIDYDFDQKLRMHTYLPEYDEPWLEGDIDDEFWLILKNNLPDSTTKECQLWIKSINDELNKEIDYQRFQMIMWSGHVHHKLDYKSFQFELFNEKTGVSNLRKHQMRARVMKDKMARRQTPDFTALLLQLISELVHILDIWTDLSLASKMYDLGHYNSKFDKKVGRQNHYNICFIWICLAVFGPYLIQYSTYMNLLYRRGVYSPHKFNRNSICRQIFMVFLMTFGGLFVMLFIDLLLKFQVFVNFVLMCCLCCKKCYNIQYYKNTSQLIKYRIERFLEMNEFEIKNSKQLFKYTEVFFENTIMIGLDLLLFIGVLKVPMIGQDQFGMRILVMQVLTTVSSIFMAFKSLFFESKILKENALDYMLVSLKAKQSWIPYAKFIETKYFPMDIHFGDIYLQKTTGSFNTRVSGNHKQLNFKFSDQTLKDLSNLIQKGQLCETTAEYNEMVQSNDIDENDEEMTPEQQQNDRNQKLFILSLEPKLIFGSSLDSVSVHVFLSFLDVLPKKYVRKNIVLDSVNWDQLLKNSKKDFSLIDEEDRPVTDFGKPLLQVCIDNEENEECWQLRGLMRKLLQQYLCDPNIMDVLQEHTILSYCVQNRKHQAFQLILKSSQKSIDPQLKNHDGTTCYGKLISLHYHTAESKMLQICTQYLAININYHLSQVEINEKLYTPIYCYIKKTQPIDMHDMVQKAEWGLYFPVHYGFQLETKEEVNQLNQLSKQVRECENVCKELLENAIINDELKNYYEEIKLNKRSMNLSNEQQQADDNLSKSLKIQMDPMAEIKFKSKNQKANLSLIAVTLQLIIEVSSILDFYSDLQIAYGLSQSLDTAWFSFTIFTILAPYYTIYTTIINLQINQVQRNGVNCFSNFIRIFKIFPTIIVLLIIIDIIYMVIQAICLPLLFPFSFFKIGQTMLDKYEQTQSRIIYKLFGLTHMEIQGFRNQRTIMQFQLESIPQIFFQFYILKRLQYLNRKGFANEIGVDASNIQFSIWCAIIHVTFELFNLLIEARTSNTPFIQYLITCYNSREQWIPRQQKLQQKHSDLNQFETIQFDEPGIFCLGTLGFKIGFMFTDQSLESLQKLISNMNICKDQNLPALMIDDSFRDVSVMKLIELGITTHGKVRLEYTARQLKRIEKEIENDEDLMDRLVNPKTNDDQSDEYILMKLVKSNQYHIVKILINLEAEFRIKSKQSNVSVVWTALKAGFYDIVTDLYINKHTLLIDKQIKTDFRAFNILREIAIPSMASQQNAYFRMIEQIYFDPANMVTSDQQFWHLFKAIQEIQDGKNVQAQIRYFIVFASSYTLPKSYLKIIKEHLNQINMYRFKEWQQEWQTIVNQLQSWRRLYPQYVTISGCGQEQKFQFSFLCKFAKIRQLYFQQFLKSHQQVRFSDQLRLQDIENCSQVKPSDLHMIQQILNRKQLQIQMQELEALDMIVDLLSLDKNRYMYFDNSRSCLNEDMYQQATKAVNITNQKQQYIASQDIKCIKEFKITQKSHDSQVLKLNSDFGKIEFHQEKSQENSSPMIIEINEIITLPVNLLNTFSKLSFVGFAETMRNNITAGFNLGNIKLIGNDEQNIEYSLEMKVYKKIVNGKFVKDKAS